MRKWGCGTRCEGPGCRRARGRHPAVRVLQVSCILFILSLAKLLVENNESLWCELCPSHHFRAVSHAPLSSSRKLVEQFVYVERCRHSGLRLKKKEDEYEIKVQTQYSVQPHPWAFFLSLKGSTGYHSAFGTKTILFHPSNNIRLSPEFFSVSTLGVS